MKKLFQGPTLLIVDHTAILHSSRTYDILKSILELTRCNPIILNTAHVWLVTEYAQTLVQGLRDIMAPSMLENTDIYV